MATEKPPLYAWRDAWMSEEGPESSTTRLVLHTLAAHMYADLSGECCPGSRLLADETGLTRKTVLTHLDRARDQCWITWPDDEAGQSRTYLATCPVDGPEGGEGGSPPLPDKVVKEIHHQPAEGGERDSPPPGGPKSGQGGESDTEGGERDSPPGGVTDTRGGERVSPKDVRGCTTDGEDGQEGAEGSSLRSSPSGEAGDVEDSGDGKQPVATMTREELLEAGPQAVGAWFGPLLRETLYPPDGRPPEDYSMGRDIEILEELLDNGHGPEKLQMALVGLAHLRDADKLDVADPGQKLTARVLRSEVAGQREPVGYFEHFGRRVLSGELDGRSRSGDGPTSIGSVLGRLEAGSDPRREEQGR